jgi:hypothetical protein
MNVNRKTTPVETFSNGGRGDKEQWRVELKYDIFDIL